jgi:hypothetical protein
MPTRLRQVATKGFPEEQRPLVEPVPSDNSMHVMVARISSEKFEGFA